MVTRIIQFKKPKVRKPVFIEGLPGVGNVGRIAAGYLIEELKAKKFAELISSHFMPITLVSQESATQLVKCEFFYWNAKQKNQRDLILMIGDSQSIDTEGHYEIVEEVIKYLKKFKVKEMFTLAGLSIGFASEKPKIIGAVNKPELVKKYKKYGIEFDPHRLGTIVGAAGLFLGIGRYYGIDCICLLGETSGMPLIPDPKSAEVVLRMISKILNLKIDTSRLEQKVKEMKDFMKRVEAMQRRILTFPLPKEAAGRERLTYIG